MSFTPLHRALGLPPSPLTDDVLNSAVEAGVVETDDLDWKSELPPAKSLSQTDVPKDIATMANSGGGMIVYGVGGKGEGLIHGETGYAFDERDDKSLAEYLYRVLMDDELAYAMGVKGHAFVKDNFDIVRQTETLESFYDDLVNEFNRR